MRSQQHLANLPNLGSLFLSGNSFTGALPDGIASLSELSSLAVNCNQFEDIPDFTGSSSLSLLLAENNQLTFADVEPNVGVPSNLYVYAPQGSVEVTETPSGSDIILSVEDDSPNNSYQWFRGGSPIGGATNASLTIPNTDPASDYHVEITNSVATELTLTSIQSATGLVVNVTSDESDPNLADGICDVDPDAAGEQCTLRAAIENANQSTGGGGSCGSSGLEITFSGVSLIQPSSALPAITNAVRINGGSGSSRIEIRGGSAGAFANGLLLTGQNVRVNNLVINGFDAHGIRITGGSGHVITNSRIGAFEDEMTNTDGGIQVEDGAADVTIGGLTADDENVIGGGVRIFGAETNGIKVLRNTIEIDPENLASAAVQVPIDLSTIGPTCSAWDAAVEGRPNLEVPSPRILSFTADSVRGVTRPAATVVAYRVEETGTARGRYWARSVVPIGSATADGSGYYQIEFDSEQQLGTEITVSMTDIAGNTSELQQVMRPVIYLPGVGGSWLVGENGENLFIPTARTDPEWNARIARLALDPTATTGPNGENVRSDGILENFGLPYRAVLQHLAGAGFNGPIGTPRAERDLWRFDYDWRRDPAKIADLLLERIDDITSNSSGDEVAAACQVDIITHSNGGMVGSSYLWKHRVHSQDHVNRVLMSAAPYLGTPQVTAAHTRGYLFEIEASIPGTDLDWGNLVTVFQNLPDGYGLMPSRKFMEVIDPAAPFQTDWYLTDLRNRPLRGYDATVGFMTAPKRDERGQPLGLARNGDMWAQQQTDMHNIMNDWRAYEGPPQIFRHVGRLPMSTTMAWRLNSFVDAANVVNSTRQQADDTDLHIFYREALQPRLGWGDGTVALVSATLGGGVYDDNNPGSSRIGTEDLSGQNTRWIGGFEYFPCKHIPIVGTDCNGPTGNSLERTVDALRSGYTLIPNPVRTTAKSVGEDEAETLVVEASGPVRVIVTDDGGTWTGPGESGPINRVRFGLDEVGYWVGLTGGTVSVPASKNYDIEIIAEQPSTTIRLTRGQSAQNQANNIFFDDQVLDKGGRLLLRLEAGGTPSEMAFEVDQDGDGSFESSAEPAVEMLSAEAGPSIPLPSPSSISEILQPDDDEAILTLEIPDVRGPTWDWEFENVPVWIFVEDEAGSGPADLTVVLQPLSVEQGVRRDTLMLALSFDNYTRRIPIPVELGVLSEAPVLAGIDLRPRNAVTFFNDSLQFWALGRDQIGFDIEFDPVWSATGGSITQSGLYFPGPDAGIFEVTATNSDGSISATIPVNIVGGVSTEEDAGVPEDFQLAQNYPNPFNPSTVIQFDLPTAEYVELVLYDLRGRQVTRIVDGNLPAGRHRATFDASRFPSGVYVYRMQAGPFVQTRRMILVR